MKTSNGPVKYSLTEQSMLGVYMPSIQWNLTYLDLENDKVETDRMRFDLGKDAIKNTN